MGLARQAGWLDPRSLPPAASRPTPTEWMAETQWLEQTLDLPTKLRLWELLDAESPQRVYSTPPEWEHRVRLDGLRVWQWARKQPRPPNGRPVALRLVPSASPYWQAVVAWVASRLELPVVLAEAEPPDVLPRSES